MMPDAQSDGGETGALAWGERLACAYREVADRVMHDLPIYNDALGVEAVGFRWFDGTIVGIMVTPWFMNVAMPADAIKQAPGSSLRMRFPVGDIEFTLGDVAQVGRVASCSLFSPMSEFADMASARATAEAALSELMRPSDSEEAVSRREPAASVIDRRRFLRGVLTDRPG